MQIHGSRDIKLQECTLDTTREDPPSRAGKVLTLNGGHLSQMLDWIHGHTQLKMLDGTETTIYKDNLDWRTNKLKKRPNQLHYALTNLAFHEGIHHGMTAVMYTMVISHPLEEDMNHSTPCIRHWMVDKDSHAYTYLLNTLDLHQIIPMSISNLSTTRNGLIHGPWELYLLLLLTQSKTGHRFCIPQQKLRLMKQPSSFKNFITFHSSVTSLIDPPDSLHFETGLIKR
jgi:hypothetical protein